MFAPVFAEEVVGKLLSLEANLLAVGVAIAGLLYVLLEVYANPANAEAAVARGKAKKALKRLRTAIHVFFYALIMHLGSFLCMQVSLDSTTLQEWTLAFACVAGDVMLVLGLAVLYSCGRCFLPGK